MRQRLLSALRQPETRTTLALGGLIVAMTLASLALRAHQLEGPAALTAGTGQYLLDKALRQAGQESKLVAAYFEARWSGLSQRMRAETFNHQEVRRWMRERFILAEFDMARNQKWAREREVERAPVVIFYTPSGMEIGRCEGFMPPKEFLENAQDLLRAGRPAGERQTPKKGLF